MGVIAIITKISLLFNIPPKLLALTGPVLPFSVIGKNPKSTVAIPNKVPPSGWIDPNIGLLRTLNLTKTKQTMLQDDSGEVAEQCGRLGFRLGLSVLRCPNLDSGLIGRGYG